MARRLVTFSGAHGQNRATTQDDRELRKSLTHCCAIVLKPTTAADQNEAHHG